jgi:hypothetical protein
MGFPMLLGALNSIYGSDLDCFSPGNKSTDLSFFYSFSLMIIADV